ncbi:Protein-methionine-sulfoxide reductase heme-binding subunit MsrQ [hydrothermal vent metagenome]|uniref:Protein-methionine-sulfoxide reductase heme-binding subunit MsrQ n=1 Tax=hydrothermal vent metagenome TaxID=652676 RepID=A0A3B0YY39_9ZZZZ
MNIHHFLKPVIFLVCLVPLALQIFLFFEGDLANPAEYAKHASGDWALRFIVLVLVVSPIKIITGYTPILRYRRMLGLYAFFYVCVHLMTFGFFDVFENSDQSMYQAIIYIGAEIIERPYITVGFAAFLMLVPLAFTSTSKIRRSMGSAWVKLHKLVYLVAVLGVLHYFWLVKKDLTDPIIYSIILTILFSIRLINYYRKKP